MSGRALFLFLAFAARGALAGAPGMPGLFAPPAAPAGPRLSYASLPLVFEPNRGQTDPKVLYLSRGNGFMLFLTATQAVLRFRGPSPKPPAPPKGAPPVGSRDAQRWAMAHSASKVLRLSWLGAAASPQTHPSQALPGRSNYFLGSDPSRWITDVPQYGRVALDEVYPGIALAYRDAGRDTLEFDWLVRPGADPGVIALRVEGAGTLHMDGQGDAIADLGDGQTFTLAAPRARQNGARVPVSFDLRGPHTLALRLGAYDHAQPLTVDPAIVYSTYLAEEITGWAYGVAADTQGDTYVTGLTYATNFPTTSGALLTSTANAWVNTFVSKIAPDGSAFLYSTYLGPATASTSITTIGYAIAVDAADNAYIVGDTDGDFPLVNPEQPACGACPGTGNAFVSKLNPLGNALVYSTYLGGSGGETAKGVAVDGSGAAIVVGTTASSDFPTVNALQNVCGGCSPPSPSNAFVAKFSPAGNTLAYSTYFGLVAPVEADSVALDPAGDAYVAGSGSVPLASPVYTTGGGYTAEFAPNGNRLIFSTQLAGTLDAESIAVDPSGAAYIAGTSPNILTPVRPQQSQPAPMSYYGTPYAMKLQTGGSSVAYSTYVGGTVAAECQCSIAVGPGNSACVVVDTSTLGLPLVNPVQTACPGCSGPGGQGFDPYLEVLSPDGTSLLFSTYFGGTPVGVFGNGSGSVIVDSAVAIAADASGNIYLAGVAVSNDFPLVNALNFGASNNSGLVSGNEVPFAAKISLELSPSPTPTATVSPTPSPTPSVSPPPTASPTASTSPTRSPSFTASPTPSASPTTTPNLFLIHGLINDCGAFPNPFADRLNLCVALSVPSQVTVTVYDVAGELVDRLTVSEGIGDQDVVWGGVNRFGQRCASGVYLVRVAAVGANGAQGGYWERVAIVR